MGKFTISSSNDSAVVTDIIGSGSIQPWWAVMETNTLLNMLILAPCGEMQ